MANSSAPKPIRRSLLLAIPFILVYWLIRSVPVTPCDFLHKESYNLGGELDYCGPGDAEFVDLSIRKWPMNLDFKPIDKPIVGQPCRFEINIKQFDGSPLGPDDVARSHTKKIHLMAINQSLEDYQHLHPVADELFDGTWRFTMTPEMGGTYKVFLDFIPIRSPRRVLLAASFSVQGQAKENIEIDGNLISKIGGQTFSLKTSGRAKIGSEISLELNGVNQDGVPVELTPVMGAFAHMVAFDPQLNGFAHLHPSEDTLPRSLEEAHAGPLTFSFVPPREGIYRLWAQIRLKDMEGQTFIPFNLLVDS